MKSISATEPAPLYKVVKRYKNTDRRQVLRRDLTLEEARRVVKSYPSRPLSMVTFTKQ